jgi:shikimate kinase
MILSLGGGTFAQPRNAALIRDFGVSQRVGVAVVWLDCTIEMLLQRCVLMGDRPLFRDEESFRKLHQERLPYYQQADYRVQSDGESARVVEQIMSLGLFDRSARASADEAAPRHPLL